jgi:nucleoside 2-deoxyribosyltransferase
MIPSETQQLKNPKSYFLNLSYTSGESPSKIEQIISKYFGEMGFEVKTGRRARAGEKLDKGILQVIKSCGFGIVVYNELRHNISYEWGIMDALGIPVIPFKNANHT